MRFGYNGVVVRTKGYNRPAVRAHVCEGILSGRVLGREGGYRTFEHGEQLYKD